MSVASGIVRAIAQKAIRARLGGYRSLVAAPDPALPQRLVQASRVAVVGGGLAGITASESLARRGFAVTLFEASAAIGGKIGGASALDPDGREVAIDHGFHAFFRHYHNLTAFLERAAVAPMHAIDDYVIVGSRGEVTRFGDVETTPLLNVLALADKGVFRLGEVSSTRTRTRMHELLRYDPVRTFRDFDDTSFAAFADEAALPPRLRRVFGTFARAFFAEDHRLSAAELIKAFHVYYLGHDAGLLYDHPRADAAEALVAPITRYLARLGVDLRVGTAVAEIGLDQGAVVVGSDRFDACVIATPATAASALVARSPQVSAVIPGVAAKLRRLERSARYAVLRVWLDRDPCPDVPVFVSTDRVRLLDAVASYHRITGADAAWAKRAGSSGAVLELHSYAIPDDLEDRSVRGAMLDELPRFFPGAAAAMVLGAHLAIRDDFTARHVGLAPHRPGTATDDPRIVLAGDWVDLPFPALLMEGACASGLLAANTLADRHGLSRDAIWSIPPRGALAF